MIRPRPLQSCNDWEKTSNHSKNINKLKLDKHRATLNARKNVSHPKDLDEAKV